ncbi:hypothetical protein VIGAN_06106900 [Vigna angularis var. angularis]|uniref:Zinc finger RING-H2-type domain-containing protein n=1 Tax=Vigna angularis var. angularis TaxID=157739 RepID=A0A0S3SAW4_PHAAN|nr:hypothetical protein VIGAN_06106900 [Vigna angularis var. angularis]
MSVEVTLSVRTTNLYSHYILDAYENEIMHRMTEYDGHQPNLNRDVPVSSSLVESLNPHFNASTANFALAPHNARHTYITNPLFPCYCVKGYMMTHDSNGLILGIYFGGQHYQPVTPFWSDHLQYHLFYYQTHLVQEVRSDSMNFDAPVIAPSFGILKNPPRSFSIPLQNAPFTSTHIHQPPPLGHRINISSMAFHETDESKNNEEIEILQCKHKFHGDCIKRWLHEKAVCCICKSEIFDHERKLE